MRWLVIAVWACVWSGAACAQFLDAAAANTDAAATTSPATAAGPESPLSTDYLMLFLSDAKETVTWPAHWDGDDWRTAGLIGGGIILTGALLDKPIRDAAQRGRHPGNNLDSFFTKVQRFGTKHYGLPVLAGFYAYGVYNDDYEAKATALDGFAASLITGLVTSGIKGISGRARPNTGHGPGHFRPFQGDQSFPSGHTTGAFTFASVIAAHYDDNPWVDVTAYGIASLVGAARIRLDAHWMSDVAGGALVGGLIGHHLVEFNRRWRAQHEAWVPSIETDGEQLLLTWRF